MIIVKMMGNLGNQLFIYAFARSLQLKTKERVVFDLSGLKRYYYTANYQLDNYQLPEEVSCDFGAVPSDIKKRFRKLTNQFFFEQKFDKIIHNSRMSSDALVKRWEKRGCYFDYSGFSFREYPILNTSDIFVYGYFQSSKYFDCYREILENDLTLKQNFNEYEKRLMLQMECANSVGVSIRTKYDKRGDSFILYDYYLRGMREVADKIKDPQFFVFSDDPERVKQEIHFDFPVVFVNQANACKQLYLLSCCQNFILANSTFSWWGAYLCKNQKKIIIMPSPWHQKLSSKDIYLDGATLIPCSFAK